MTKQSATAFEWAKLIIGAVMFVGLIYVHAYVKELSVFILALPAAVMGVDLSKLLNIGGKK